MHGSFRDVFNDSPIGIAEEKPFNMACYVCNSEGQKEFRSEIAIHFSGKENLTVPHVFVFPTLLVCFGCGFTGFSILKDDLRRLTEDSAAKPLPSTS